MRNNRVLPVFSAFLMLAAFRSAGLAQTVGRAVNSVPASPVSGMPGRVGVVSGPGSSVSLSISPITSSVLPSAPAVSVREVQAGPVFLAPMEQSPSAPEVPGSGQAVSPESPYLPVLVRTEGAVVPVKTDGSLLPVVSRNGRVQADGRAIEGVVLDERAGDKTVSKLDAADELAQGMGRAGTAEEAKSISGAQFGDSRSSEKGGVTAPTDQTAAPVKRGLFSRLLPARWSGLRSASPAAGVNLLPSRGAAEAPVSPVRNLRNVVRGVFYGLGLVVAPIATSFALDPIDSALGLQPFPLLKYLTHAFPAFGVPFALGWSLLSLVVPLLGFLAIKKGLKSLAPSMPKLPLVLAGAALAATAFSAVFLHSLPALVLLSMLSTIVLATGEEVMFRAGVLAWLKRKLSARGARWAVPVAVVVSSVLFSLMHLPVHSFTLDLFALKVVLGIVLSLLYLRTGNLAAPAAAHSAYNILVSVLAPLVAALSGIPVAGLASIAVLGVVFLALRSGWFPGRPKVPPAV